MNAAGARRDDQDFNSDDDGDYDKDYDGDCEKDYLNGLNVPRPSPPPT
jgi:hypothetical protein